MNQSAVISNNDDNSNKWDDEEIVDSADVIIFE